MGHSLGGLTAALVAAARPEAIRRLVIVDITPGVVPGRDAGSIAEFITGQRDYATPRGDRRSARSFGIGSDRAALLRGVALNTRRRPDGRWEWTHHLAHLEGLPIAKDGDPAPLAPLWGALESVAAAGVPLALIAASQGLVGEALREGDGRIGCPAGLVTIEGPHNLHEAAPRELAAALG